MSLQGREGLLNKRQIDNATPGMGGKRGARLDEKGIRLHNQTVQRIAEEGDGTVKTSPRKVRAKRLLGFSTKDSVLLEITGIGRNPDTHEESSSNEGRQLSMRVISSRESIGKLVREIGQPKVDEKVEHDKGGAVVSIRQFVSSHSIPLGEKHNALGARKLQGSLVRQYPNMGDRLSAARGVIGAMKSENDDRMRDLSDKAIGLDMEAKLAEKPREYRAGIKALGWKVLGVPANVGKRITLNGRGLEARLPGDKLVHVTYEELSAGAAPFDVVAGTHGLFKIIQKGVAVLGKKYDPPVGTVSLVYQGTDEPITTVTVRNPGAVARSIQETSQAVSLRSIPATDELLPEYELGDLIPSVIGERLADRLDKKERRTKRIAEIEEGTKKAFRNVLVDTKPE